MAALTYSEIMRGVWTELGHITTVTATGGTATTIVDTNSRYTTDNALLGGTAIVVSTTDGLSPQGKFARISAFVASTETFTMDTVTDAVGAGDIIALVRPTIPLLQMKQAVNDALKDHIGTISKLDISLTSAGDEATYALPAGVWIKRLIDVRIGNATDGYVSIINKVEVEPSSTGGTLLSHGLEAGQTLKVIYEGTHSNLTVYSDKVHESIPDGLIKAATLQKALTWYVSKKDNSALGTFIIQRLNSAEQQLANYKVEQPVLRVRTAPRWFPK